MPKTIAVIPAKGYSRRVPRKNMKLLGGKPLLAYSIATARACQLIDEVYVSTDDNDIASFARSCGAHVPFLRDPVLSQDHVHGTEPVLDLLRRIYDVIDDDLYCVRLLPPYPFLTEATVRSVISKAHTHAQNTLSIVPLDINIYHLKLYNPDGTIQAATSADAKNFQIEDAPELYALSGAAQCAPAADLLAHGSYHYGTPLGQPIPRLEGFEVDTLDAFALAERLLPALGSH